MNNNPKGWEMRKLMMSLGFTVLSSIAYADSVLTITSDSIVNGKIKTELACNEMGGSRQSPHLKIAGVAPDVKFLAIIVDDPDAVAVAGKTWVHWNVFNVPASTVEVLQGKAPEGEVKNSTSNSSYEGMCPPNGVHTYNFAVFGMKEKIDAGGIFGISPITIERFQSKFKDVILQKAVIQGRF